MRLTAFVRPRRFRGLLLSMVVSALMAASSVAHAQGTSGTLPDPIDARELNRYAERLQLSPQQRQAVDSMHEQYKREFRALREGEIADFLKSMRDLNGAGTIPKRDVIEKFMRSMDQLNRKVAQVDSRLFDQMQEVLTPEQLALMPRVRQTRQRERYVSQNAMSMGGQGMRVDLSQLLYEMELTSEERQNVDSTMAAYEGKLTQLMSKLHDSSAKMMMDMFDAMEKLGFTEKSMEDPETAQKMGEAMQNMWQDLTKKAMELAGDIADLNHKTSKQLASLLPGATGRTLLHTYWQKAYPEASMSFGASDAIFQALLKIKELTPEQRQIVVNAREELDRQLDQIATQMVEYLDDFRKNRSPFDANMGDWQENQNRLSEFQQKFATATEASTDALRDTLGPEVLAKIPNSLLPKKTDKNPKAIKAEDEAEVFVAEADGGGWSAVGVAASASPDEDRVQGPDMFLPAAITSREISEYAARLELTEDQKSVLDGLFERYAEQFGAASVDEVQKLVKAQQGLWHYDEASNTSTGPTESQMDEVYRLRNQALETVLRVDEQFFGEVETALLNEQQKPKMTGVRLARQRVVYNRGADAYSMMGGSSEAGLDLGRMVRQLHLDQQQLASLGEELNRYEEQAAAGFKAKYQAALEVQKAQEKWNSQMMKSQADGGNSMQLAMKYREILAAPQKSLRQASENLAKLNHDTVDHLVAALPVEPANSLRSTYDRRAFPTIYNDTVACLNQIDMALRLSDLTDEQRNRIDNIAAEYRPGYAHLSDQMVQESAGGLSLSMGMGFEPEDWQKWQERQDALAKLAFDRNELSLKTLRQLKAALSESQVEQLGGLHEPKVPESRQWY